MIDKLKGFLLSAILGIFIIYLGEYFTFINSIISGLLIGIIVGNFIKISTEYSNGIAYTGTKFLEVSILFLAFGINYKNIASLGFTRFFELIIAVFLVLVFAVFLAKKMRCPSSVGWLIGFGTAICGSSAIAALSPSVAKSKEDVGVAMAVVNLYGTLGMLIIPPILMYLGWNVLDSSMLLGGSLHSVGNVAGAGYSMSNEVGEMALTVKLARVALLSPALIFFNIILQKDGSKNWKQHLKLPWYLWSFIIITIFISIIPINTKILETMEALGKIILTIAMVAIGLRIKFIDLWQTGKKGLFYGAVIFLFYLAVLVTLIRFL